jgi:hypothetical protein
VKPCYPSPCGTNAVCKERNGAGSCSCMPNYFGDPYVNCRPECIQNSDCPHNRACVNTKCIDPCIGTCGFNANCRIVNHNPVCSCQPGYTGNPSSNCYPLPVETPSKISNFIVLFIQITQAKHLSSILNALSCKR